MQTTPTTRRLALRILLGLALVAQTHAAGAANVEGGPPRIVNGLPTQTHPTVGALLWKSGSDTYRMVCSGTLVGCGTFLTASHCVCDGPTSARCGTPDPGRYAVFLQHVGIVDVSAVVPNPDFFFYKRGDVAVLTLAQPTTGVRPSRINTVRQAPFGTTGEIVGYGITQGFTTDYGLLRRGLVETAACASSNVDPTEHVCWNFNSPLSAPGYDSNTCNGDSGGPLFADLGGGESVVGVTSGGAATSCLPADSSFDADVFANRAFIQATAGADLSTASCGAISQVGDPGTLVSAESVGDLTRDARACRKAATSAYDVHLGAVHAALRSCIDGVRAGKRAGPCPDAATLAAIASAGARVGAGAFAGSCSDGIVPAIAVAGDCASADDRASLVSCITSAGEAAALRAIDLEYADATAMAPIADPAALACQAAIARAGAGMLRTLLVGESKCQGLEDAGRVGACPDPKLVASATRAEARAAGTIARFCSDASVASLRSAGAFGADCAGATDLASLVECQRSGHRSLADDLHSLLQSQTMHLDIPFEVAPGTSVLRFTLNGVEGMANDLDLYVRHGAPASEEVFDGASARRGTFESVEIAAPSSGTWWAHVDRYAGTTRIPYQLTVSRFAH